MLWIIRKDLWRQLWKSTAKSYCSYFKSLCNNYLDKYIEEVFGYKNGFVKALLTSDKSLQNTIFVIVHNKIANEKLNKNNSKYFKKGISSFNKFEEIFFDYYDLCREEGITNKLEPVLIKYRVPKKEYYKIFKNRLNTQTRVYSKDNKLICALPIRNIKNLFNKEKTLEKKYNELLDNCVENIKFYTRNVKGMYSKSIKNSNYIGFNYDSNVIIDMNDKKRVVLYTYSTTHKNYVEESAKTIQEISIDHSKPFEKEYKKYLVKGSCLKRISDYFIEECHNNKISEVNSAKNFDRTHSHILSDNQEFCDIEFLKKLYIEIKEMFNNQELVLMNYKENIRKNNKY